MGHNLVVKIINFSLTALTFIKVIVLADRWLFIDVLLLWLAINTYINIDIDELSIDATQCRILLTLDDRVISSSPGLLSSFLRVELWGSSTELLLYPDRLVAWDRLTIV